MSDDDGLSDDERQAVRDLKRKLADRLEGTLKRIYKRWGIEWDDEVHSLPRDKDTLC